MNVLLAKTLSEMGQRVLLIDADLRKPQMHLRLGLNNLSGLSNVLTEPDQTWRDAVQHVPGYENWTVLTAGQQHQTPHAFSAPIAWVHYEGTGAIGAV